MHVTLRNFLAAIVLVGTVRSVEAGNDPRTVIFVHMGGNDCPPCVAWRANELPKLQASEQFRKIRFAYVVKTIKAPVPPAAFLPPELRPFKDQLDFASGGRGGSPHQAFIVDGKVYDYWFGPKGAEEIEAAVTAILDGTRYPHRRCLKRTGGGDRSCEIRAPRDGESS
jgi:hypothetical protein